MGKREDQRAAEMARGAEIQRRAERYSILERMEKANKISIRYNVDNNYAQVWLVERACIRNGVSLYVAELIAEETDPKQFPSEVFFATVLLVVNAAVGMEGLPDAQNWISPAERKRRDKYRKTLPNGRW